MEAASPIDFAVVPPDLANGSGLVKDGDFRLDFKNDYELSPRGGLNQAIAKLKAGGEVRVAYLGGSITQAETGWRPRTTRWIKSHFPKASITEIPAAINGTGADLGAARLQQDVLAHSPDLLFVEFAVNGGDAGLKNGMVKTVEGIVRQAWKSNPRMDICFVYAISKTSAAGYRGGAKPILTANVSAQEKVADYYQIPSIQFGCQVGFLEDRGELTFQSAAPVPSKIVFSKDGIHPTNDGAQLYAGAVARSFLKLEQAAKQSAPHRLIPPLEPDNWEGAKLVPLNKVKTTGDWQWHKMEPASPHYSATFADEGYNLPIIKSLFPQLLGTKTPGSSLALTFKGTILGFFDVGGPFSGQIKVSIDGAAPVRISRFSIYNTHLRQQYFFLPQLPNAVHHVTLTLDDAAPDKSRAPDFAVTPAKYARNEIYLGKIILVGDLIETPGDSQQGAVQSIHPK